MSELTNEQAGGAGQEHPDQGQGDYVPGYEPDVYSPEKAKQILVQLYGGVGGALPGPEVLEKNDRAAALLRLSNNQFPVGTTLGQAMQAIREERRKRHKGDRPPGRRPAL